MTLDQNDKIEGLDVPKTPKEFCSKRAMCQYIAVNTRPDACATIQLIAPGSEDTTGQEFKILEKTIGHLKDTKRVG